jgi:putative DNA primase/helicase
VFGRFIDECCLVGDSYRVKASDLYEAYKSWCEASGETSVTLSTFGNRLEDRGYRKHKIGTIWRLGIALDTHSE